MGVHIRRTTRRSHTYKILVFGANIKKVDVFVSGWLRVIAFFNPEGVMLWIVWRYHFIHWSVVIQLFWAPCIVTLKSTLCNGLILYNLLVFLDIHVCLWPLILSLQKAIVFYIIREVSTIMLLSVNIIEFL